MARDFEAGSSEYIGRANHITGNTTNISFGGWINAESWVNEATFFMNGVTGGFGQGYALQQLVSGGNKIRIDLAFVAAIVSTSTFSTGTWIHVMATRGASTWNIYINGASEATSTSSPFGLDTNSNTVLGARVNSGGTYDNHFDGLMAEWAFWTRELSAAEVASLAKGYSPQFFSDSMISYKPLTGPSATTDYIDDPSAWTASGTANAAHPRIYYPSSFQTYAVAAGGVSTSVKDLIMSGLIPFAR